MHSGNSFCTAKKQKQPLCTNQLYPQVFTASGSKKKCGVLIAVSYTVAFRLHDMIIDTAGRFIVLVCEMNNVMYTLINLYAPNCRQLPFLHTLKKKVDSIKKGLVLYCGDFNCVPNKQLDYSAPQRSARSEIQPFLHTSDLHDIWCCVNSGEKTLLTIQLPTSHIQEFIYLYLTCLF